MKPLVFTEDALNVLATKDIPPSWFLLPKQISAFDPLVVVENDKAIYVLSPSSTGMSRKLVIRRQEDGLFGGVVASERRQVFDRCVRIALRDFGSSVQLNPKWMPYHMRNLVSVYAYGEKLGTERVVSESRPYDSHDVYVCEFSPASNVYNLDDFKPNHDAYDLAISGFDSAIAASKQKEQAVVEGQIELDDVIPSDISKSLTFSEWFKHLSKRQQTFVEHELNGPLRLRGAAGTGKTLAMIIKALKMAYDAEDAHKPMRILFATHSWAGAELVDNVKRRIDSRDVFRTRTDGVAIDVFPLLSIAEKRDYSQIGFRPLGIDSSEGKKLALEEISSVIAEFMDVDWIAYKSDCSAEFSERVEAAVASKTHKLFCWDLLIEFGCVIAAQGILTRDADRQKYLRVKRLRWMMNLANRSEKEAVFRMWTMFLGRLRSRYLVSSDQVIFDCLSDLGTFFWESARRKEGYDAIFVDEMHLFNSQERLIFHNLLREPDRPPAVAMALDPNQSPRETFVDVKSEDADPRVNIYDQARLPNPVSIDLTEVYRYTPEINELVRGLYEVVPALDLPQDWDVPAGHSQLSSGEMPTYKVFPDALTMFRAAIDAARRLVRESAKRHGRVSILCLDEERFETYSRAAEKQYETEAFIIASRDDTERLRYSGRKFLLSTPEYVAGLQFDTVILIDANKSLVPDGANTGYLMRRILSELYLGISRAERRLLVFASQDAGGISSLLGGVIAKGLLVEAKE